MLKLKIILFSLLPILFTNMTNEQSFDQQGGKIFPTIVSKSLSGEEVNLPADVKGQITLITIAFLESGQPYIDSWANPYLEEYYGEDGFSYYEVPLLNAMPQNAKDYIDSGMRAGIEKKMHPNVVTFYGDYTVYTESLGIEDIRSGYAFLLNRNGEIIYRGEGMMSDKNWEEIKHIIKKQQL